MLHLSGGSFWRRVPRDLVVQYVCDYWEEVPLPLSEGGLLWEFDDDFGGGDSGLGGGSDEGGDDGVLTKGGSGT